MIIHLFPGANSNDSDRLAALEQHTADANALAAELGTRLDWICSAVDHLKIASSGNAGGSTVVSTAALHIVLGYVEELEGREAAGGAA